jgi:hypothetical protein
MMGGDQTAIESFLFKRAIYLSSIVVVWVGVRNKFHVRRRADGRLPEGWQGKHFAHLQVWQQPTLHWVKW